MPPSARCFYPVTVKFSLKIITGMPEVTTHGARTLRLPGGRPRIGAKRNGTLHPSIRPRSTARSALLPVDLRLLAALYTPAHGNSLGTGTRHWVSRPEIFGATPYPK